VIANFIRRVVPKRFRPIGYLEHLVSTNTADCVNGGPFAGMRYIHGAVGSAYVPKLLGIYERELNACIEQACALNFPLIVDIGAAEGYYAVGMALRNPDARIVAFEMEGRGRKALQEMAKLNELGPRIEIHEKCGCDDLQSILTDLKRALVICDVEGNEDELLNPVVIPTLARTHVLVETHDFVLRGITESLIQRFSPTHDIQRIWQQPRQRADMPYRAIGATLLPRRYLDWAVSEWRPERMSWLWMEPRRVNGAA
jgi:hypothetical protein